MISFVFRAGLIVFITVFLWVPTAFAAKDDRVSSGEEIAVAFFKTAEATPNFESWIRESKEFKRLSPVRAGEHMEKEKRRLVGLWHDFDPQEDIISISTDVDIELKRIADKKGVEQYWMYIILPPTELTHFGYKHHDYRFAIIPQKIDDLMIQPLQKEQFEHMAKAFGQGGPAKLFLQLKPVKAHTDQPYKIDGVERWAFICDIATMAVGGRRDPDIYWNYGAEWYVSPVTEGLQDLYKAPAESVSTP